VADVPNFQIINFVDTPITLQFSATGSAQAMLTTPNNPVVDITGFRKVSIRLDPSKLYGMTCEIMMGQIAPNTMCSAFKVPIDSAIHTFDVVGPQTLLSFANGPANTTKTMQLLVYLRS